MPAGTHTRPPSSYKHERLRTTRFYMSSSNLLGLQKKKACYRTKLHKYAYSAFGSVYSQTDGILSVEETEAHTTPQIFSKSENTCSSSSGVKSLTIPNMARTSSTFFPVIMPATFIANICINASISRKFAALNTLSPQNGNSIQNLINLYGVALLTVKINEHKYQRLVL
uniref:Uncharacterized protein n=1 Tax=Ascaris lumbricoides TaxID=6252 RepID=A0A9J2NZ20_ASCLU